MSKSGSLEWLVTDGTGAFAFGCADRAARRKYHTLLSLADGVLAHGGKNLVLDLDETITMGSRRVSLSEESPEFSASPWPTWTWRLAGITRQLRPIEHGSRSDMESGFELVFTSTREEISSLHFRPRLLSRPLHSRMERNPSLNGMAHSRSGQRGAMTWEFQLYPHDPRIVFAIEGASAKFSADGQWERITHPWEADRGYAAHEDSFVPGEFTASGTAGTAFALTIRIGYRKSDRAGAISVPSSNRLRRETEPKKPTGRAAKGAKSASRISNLATSLRVAAQSFSADAEDSDGGCQPTLLAGLPWFGPWTRDLFICLPGYARAVGRSELPYLMLVTAGKTLLETLRADRGRPAPSSLNPHGADSPWLYLWALEQLVGQSALSPVQAQVCLELGADLAEAVLRGAQSHVSADPQGGIRIARGPWAATWMDAMIDGHPVTPRHGYPVEINALFISGLGFLREQLKTHSGLGRFAEAYEASRQRFSTLFAPPAASHLADLWSETPDLTIRPNALWALALPRVPVHKDMALKTLKTIRTNLLTPAGLRTLSPSDPAYRGRCEGDQRSRDLAYHQGTVWPWLVGIYSDAVAAFEGRAALSQQLAPIWERMEIHLREEGCLGQVSEIFDGDAPHEARGAPAQAWSACELLRVIEDIQK